MNTSVDESTPIGRVAIAIHDRTMAKLALRRVTLAVNLTEEN